MNALTINSDNWDAAEEVAEVVEAVFLAVDQQVNRIEAITINLLIIKNLCIKMVKHTLKYIGTTYLQITIHLMVTIHMFT